jgi:hypothetical protein
MAYDARRRRCVLLAERDDPRSWEWDGSSWVLGKPLPMKPGWLAACYDECRGAVVVISNPWWSEYVSWGGPRSLQTFFLQDRSCLPTLTVPPAPATAPVGTRAVFSVAAGGADRYRWRFHGLPLQDGPRVSGSATQTLTIDGVSMTDRGDYSVSVSNSCGTLTSDPVLLTVTGCYANCDESQGDPALNVVDFICFLNRFAAGESYANCDGSTVPPVLSVADFVCFLNRYAEGCP